MKLSLNQIKEITKGAVSVIEEDGTFRLFRFTEEQMELYKVTNSDFYNKAFSTAGIKFLFKTDSENLFLKFETMIATTRKFFAADVFVNGIYNGSIDNFTGKELPLNYTQADLPMGSFSKKFNLGKGEKTVCIHLPFSTKVLIEELSLDDNAFIEGIKLEKKLLAFGDSITHGYDALHPSNRYVAKLSEMLGAEEFNKAIGGEMYFPELAKLKETFLPDYITVAYGTNDWSKIGKDAFMKNCRGFYENLVKSYPECKIFAITPIWRKDMNEKRAFGAFNEVEKAIRECVKDLENVLVISGFDFVPQDEKYYADLRLHPNDEGFRHYAENLYAKIKAEL